MSFRRDGAARRLQSSRREFFFERNRQDNPEENLEPSSEIKGASHGDVVGENSGKGGFHPSDR